MEKGYNKKFKIRMNRCTKELVYKTESKFECSNCQLFHVCKLYSEPHKSMSGKSWLKGGKK